MNPPPTRRNTLLRYGLFIAALAGAAILLLTQPPEYSPLVFALMILAALLVAGVDQAIREGYGPGTILRLAGRIVREAWDRFWRARREAEIAPPLAQTLARRLPAWQAALELTAVILLAASVPTAYHSPDSLTQLPGFEAEWLTSSAHLAALNLREHGTIPLWQPYLEFGEPLIDGPFAFVLNPITAGPSLLFGGVRGIKLGVVLTAVTAGLGGWALGRVLGLGVFGRVLLALLMVGKGNMHAMIGAGYYQLGTSQAYMPWIVAGTLATLRVPHRRWPVPLTAVALTLMFWAGNIWYTLPMLLSMALLAATHAVHPRAKTWQARFDGAALRRLALALALTLGLSAITFLPIWLQRGQIGGHPDVMGAGRVADLAAVIRQFFDGRLEQYMNGTAPGATQFYYSYITTPWLAAGLFLLLPPIWPFTHRPRLRQGWRMWVPAALLIVFCTLWGAGGNPLIVWLYDGVPLLGQWRFVGRALAVASFWIGVLVAWRADALLRALLHYARQGPGIRWRRPWSTLPTLLRRGLLGGLALLVIAAGGATAQDVIAQWHDFAGTIGVNVYDEICLSWLRALHPNEELAVYRSGYDAVTPFLTHRVRLVNIEADYFPRPLPWTVGGFDLTRALPDYAIAWTDHDRLVLDEMGYFPLLDSPNPVDEHHCLYWLNERALPYAFAIPYHTMNALTGPELMWLFLTPIESLDRTPDTIRLHVTAEVTPLVVTVQERAYPGWQVWLDGARAPLESVGGQVGVVIDEPGPHEVVFAYRPPLVYLGGAITLLTWAVCILYLLNADRPLRRRLARSIQAGVKG